MVANVYPSRRIMKAGACLIVFLLVTFAAATLSAQTEDPICTFENGLMRVTIPYDISVAHLDSLVVQYGLQELGLQLAFKSGDWEKARKEGWDIRKNRKVIVLSKPTEGWEQQDFGNLISMLSRNSDRGGGFQRGVPQLFEPYGVNDFKTASVRKTSDTTAEFFLKGPVLSGNVFLSGSFNNWSTLATPMQRADSGWVVSIILPPGKYLYKFIVDGNWMSDPQNNKSEEDGYYGSNSVYYQTNQVFRLNGTTQAQKVFLAGSFNGWAENSARLHKKSAGWELPVFLKEGTYTYKYIVDGQWIADPGNALQVPDGRDNLNSMLAIGDAFSFRLRGFLEAENVMLAGNFNEWNPYDLKMIKTADGWELPYVLGPGVYTYKFIVDGKWMTDPANPMIIDDRSGIQNSLLVIKGNYTFSLQGFEDAKEIAIAGSFNNWEEHAYMMKKNGESWELTTFLEPGKHTYKFIVDGNWILDPGNKTWEENEHGSGNSVLWIGATFGGKDN